MSAQRTICVVITARPSYSRIKTVLIAIKNHPLLRLQLIVAGSALLERYGSIVDIVRADGFEIDARVFMVLEGENSMAMAKTTGIGVLELATAFNQLKPDAVVCVADRFETIAVSIAAAYQNIPLVHIQGGEVTGNIDEKVRHANTKLADLHFVASDDALQRVLRLGEAKDRVFNTGCPSIDLAAEIMNAPQLNFDPYKKYGGVGAEPHLKSGYIVVMQHPVTTEFELSRNQIEETLAAIVALQQTVFWFWPNVDAGADGTSNGIRAYREKHDLRHVHFFKNFEPNDFLRLLYSANCLVGNSSVGIRECSFLGTPVVNIGSRQQRRERAPNVKDCGYQREEILAAIKSWDNSHRPKKSEIYGDGKAGNKIATLLAELPLTFSKVIQY